MTVRDKLINIATLAVLVAPPVAYSTTQVVQASRATLEEVQSNSNPAAKVNQYQRNPKKMFDVSVSKEKQTPVVKVLMNADNGNSIVKGDKLYINFDSKNVDVNKSIAQADSKSNPYTLSKDAKNNRVVVTFTKDITDGSYAETIALSTKNVNDDSRISAKFAGSTLPVRNNKVSSLATVQNQSAVQQSDTQHQATSSANGTQQTVSTSRQANTQSASTYDTQYATQGASDSTSNATTYATQQQSNVATSEQKSNGNTDSSTSDDTNQNVSFSDAENAVNDRTTITVTGNATSTDTEPSNGTASSPNATSDTTSVTDTTQPSSESSGSTTSTTGTTSTPSTTSSASTTNTEVTNPTADNASPSQTTKTNEQTSTDNSTNVANDTNTSNEVTQSENISDSENVQTDTTQSATNNATDSLTSNEPEKGVIETPTGTASDPQATLDEYLAKGGSNVDDQANQTDTDKYEDNTQFETIKNQVYSKVPNASKAEKAEILKQMPYIWHYIYQNADAAGAEGRLWKFRTLLSTGRYANVTIDGTANNDSDDVIQRNMPALLSKFGQNIEPNAFDKAVDYDVLKDSQVYQDYLDGKGQSSTQYTFGKVAPNLAGRIDFSLTAPKDATNIVDLDSVAASNPQTTLNNALAQSSNQANTSNTATDSAAADSRTGYTALRNYVDKKTQSLKLSQQERGEIIKNIPVMWRYISENTSDDDSEGQVWYFRQKTSDGRYVYITIDGTAKPASWGDVEVNMPQILKSVGKSIDKYAFYSAVDNDVMQNSDVYQNYLAKQQTQKEISQRASNSGSGIGLGLLPLILPFVLPTLLVAGAVGLALLPVAPLLIAAAPVLIPAIAVLNVVVAPLVLAMGALALPLLPLILPVLPLLVALQPVFAIKGLIGLALAPLATLGLITSVIASVAAVAIFVPAAIATIILNLSIVAITLFNNLVVLPLLALTAAVNVINLLVVLPILTTLFAISVLNTIVLGGLILLSLLKNGLLFLINLVLLPGALLFPPLALLLGVLDLFNIFISTPLMIAIAGLLLLNTILLTLAKLPLILGLIGNVLALGLKNLLVLPLLGLQLLGLINTVLLLGLMALNKLAAIALGAIAALIGGIAVGIITYLILKTIKDLFNLALLLLGVPLVLLGIPMMLLAPLFVLGLPLLLPLLLLPLIGLTLWALLPILLPLLMPLIVMTLPLSIIPVMLILGLMLLPLLPGLILAAIPALLLSGLFFIPLYLLNKVLWLVLEPIVMTRLLTLPLLTGFFLLWIVQLITWPLNIILNFLPNGLFGLTVALLGLPFILLNLFFMQQLIQLPLRFIDFLLPINIIPLLITLGVQGVIALVSAIALATLNPLGGVITLGLLGLLAIGHIIMLNINMLTFIPFTLFVLIASIGLFAFGLFTIYISPLIAGLVISILLPGFISLAFLTLLSLNVFGYGLPIIGLFLRGIALVLALLPLALPIILPSLLLGGGLILFNFIKSALFYLVFAPILWAGLWTIGHFVIHFAAWLLSLLTWPFNILVLLIPGLFWSLQFALHGLEYFIGLLIFMYNVFMTPVRFLLLGVSPIVWMLTLFGTLFDALALAGLLLAPLATLPLLLLVVAIKFIVVGELMLHQLIFPIMAILAVFIGIAIPFFELLTAYISPLIGTLITSIIPGIISIAHMIYDLISLFGFGGMLALGAAITLLPLLALLALPLILLESLGKLALLSIIPFLLGLGMTLLGLAQQLIALAHLLFLDWILPIIPALLLGNLARLLLLPLLIGLNLLLSVLPDLLLWPLVGLNLLKQLLPLLALPLMLGSSLIPMALKLLGLGLLNLLRLPNLLGLLALIPLILFNMFIKIPLLTLGTIIFALLGLAHILLRLLNHALQLFNLLKQAIELPLMLWNLLKQAILLPLILLTLFNNFIDRLLRDALALQHLGNTLLRNLVLIPLALLANLIKLAQILPWLLSTFVGIPLSLFNMINPWFNYALSQLLKPLWIANMLALPLSLLLGNGNGANVTDGLDMPDLSNYFNDIKFGIKNPLIGGNNAIDFDKLIGFWTHGLFEGASIADFDNNNDSSNALTGVLGNDAANVAVGDNDDNSSDSTDPNAQNDDQKTFPQTSNDKGFFLTLLGVVMAMLTAIAAAFKRRKKHGKGLKIAKA